MIKVRYISDTSIMMDERTIRWRPNESTEGAAAGSGASGRGSPEFLGDFTKTVAGLRLTHYYNRPTTKGGGVRYVLTQHTGLADQLLLW
jgi:hypothetical protein